MKNVIENVCIMARGDLILAWVMFMLFGSIGGLSITTNLIVLFTIVYLYLSIDNRTLNPLTIFRNLIK